MKNVLNTLRVIEEVAARQPVGVSELARVLEMPKTSVQRALQTLRTAGWLAPTDDETTTRWALTSRALHVGQQAMRELSLRDAAIPVMRELRRRTEETIHLMVPEGRNVVLIERLDTPKLIRITLPLGSSAPIHASSNGKAVLASSRPDVVEDLIAEGLPRYTDSTIVDPGSLREELEMIRKRGFATNTGEWRADIAAVAAAIMGDNGRPVGSLSISTPADRMPPEMRLPYGELVRDAAREISVALGHVAPADLAGHTPFAPYDGSA